MSIKIHFKGYRTAHLQIYKWLMYTHNIIRKILEKTNKQTNKTKINIMYYFFLSLRAGGILQILQSDWFRERAVFYDLAR